MVGDPSPGEDNVTTTKSSHTNALCFAKVLTILDMFTAIAIRDQQGLHRPAGFMTGFSGVGVRVDIQLPHPNPYPGHGYHGF